MVIKKRMLIKVWFRKLHEVAFASEPGTVSPGGAGFSRGYYVAMDLAEGWLILCPGTKIQKRDSMTFFHFENGSTCCVTNHSISKIERVQFDGVIEPLMRNDLVVVRATIPLENSERIIRFFIIHNNLVLDRVARDSKMIRQENGEQFEIPTVVYKILVLKKNLKRFLKEFFKAKLTPPGREWMVFHSTPTTESVKAFRATPY